MHLFTAYWSSIKVSFGCMWWNIWVNLKVYRQKWDLIDSLTTFVATGQVEAGHRLRWSNTHAGGVRDKYLFTTAPSNFGRSLFFFARWCTVCIDITPRPLHLFLANNCFPNLESLWCCLPASGHTTMESIGRKRSRWLWMKARSKKFILPSFT